MTSANPRPWNPTRAFAKKIIHYRPGARGGNNDRGTKQWSRSLPRPVALFTANLQGSSGIFAGKNQVRSIHTTYTSGAFESHATLLSTPVSVFEETRRAMSTPRVQVKTSNNTLTY